MHVIRLDGMGRARLVPPSSRHWERSHDSASWPVRVTAYGPSTSTGRGLAAKLDGDIGLSFGLNSVDPAGRAQAFQKLVAGGVSVNEARAIPKLLAPE